MDNRVNRVYFRDSYGNVPVLEGRMVGWNGLPGAIGVDVAGT